MLHNSKRSDDDADVYEEAVAASGEMPTRLGGNAGPAESDVWTDVEDAEVDAAEGVETRARPRACGDASDDAEDAVAGEGKATLTRTRLGAAARPGDADDGEAIAGADVIRVLTPNRCGVAVFRS